MKKTNAIRILDHKIVSYETLAYEYDSVNLSAEKIAESNELKIKEIFKTLVVKGDKNGVAIAVISGNQTLNFKALAKTTGNKKITLVPVKELLPLTGYIRGGCSPIGMKKEFPVYIDTAAKDLEAIFINAGIRGLLIKIKTKDLLQVTKGVIADISVI